MAIAIVMAADDLGISSWWMGLISAGSLVGIFLGSGLAGLAADRFGRQTVITCDRVLFVAACLAQLWAPGPATLLAIRVVLGVAIGAEYAIATALLAEFTPRKLRSRCLSTLNTMWLVGYAIAFFASTALQEAGASWRWVLATSTVVAAVALASRLGAPESPRWLASKGRTEEARAIVKRRYGERFDVDDLALEETARARYSILFGPLYRTRTAFAAIFWTCQITVGYAILLFLPLLFEALDIAGGFTADVAVNAAIVAGGVLGVYLCCRLPRRPLIIWSFVVMTILLLILAAWELVPGWLTLIVLAVCMLVSNASSSLEFVYPPEMFPTRVRSSAIGFAAATARIGAVMGTFVLPALLDTAGPAWTFGILAGVQVIGTVASVLWAPETRDLSLLESSGVAHLHVAPAADPMTASPDDRLRSRAAGEPRADGRGRAPHRGGSRVAACTDTTARRILVDWSTPAERVRDNHDPLRWRPSPAG